jgi:cyclase
MTGLAHRIIPTILCRGRQLVKGVAFDSWRSVGLAAQAVKIHAMRGVDEVCLLDITATKEGRGPDLTLVEELSQSMFAPLAVGGGVRNLDDVKALLRAGADKVVIGTAFVDLPEMRRIADAVGRQALIASVDVRDGEVMWQCGSVSVSGSMNPVAYAKLCADVGAGEILLQSIDRDGTMAGYNLALISAVSMALDCPVIASGGCGTYEHMREALDAGASAVAAGAMFQFSDATPRGAARYLAQHGVEVRL